jgi:hypothetical protein
MLAEIMHRKSQIIASRTILPDKAILMRFSGSFANYQRSQDIMPETLYT